EATKRLTGGIEYTDVVAGLADEPHAPLRVDGRIARAALPFDRPFPHVERLRGDSLRIEGGHGEQRGGAAPEQLTGHGVLLVPGHPELARGAVARQAGRAA